MVEEKTKIVEKVTLDPTGGQFAFQFPEGTSDDEVRDFFNALEEAKKNSTFVEIAPEVKIISLKTPKSPPVEPVKPPTEAELKAKVDTPPPAEKPAEKQPEKVPEKAPEPEVKK